MRIIDLSDEIYDGQRSHFNVTIRDHLTHADTAPRLAEPARGFATKVLFMPDHVSTHVDAPSHFWPGRMDINEVPIETFCGEAIVVDFAGADADGGELAVEPFERNVAENDVEFRLGDIVHPTEDG